MMISYCSPISHAHLSKCHHPHPHRHLSISVRRHLRRRRHLGHPSPSRPPLSLPSDQSLHVVIDVQHLSNKASNSIDKFLSESRLSQFLRSCDETVLDLRNLVTLDHSGRVIVSCGESSVRFAGRVVILGFLIFFAFRGLARLAAGFRDRIGSGHRAEVIRRRDRSLGGREVVVAKRERKRDGLPNPRVSSRSNVGKSSEDMSKIRFFKRKNEELPKWWPVSLPLPAYTDNKKEYQRLANILIRVIMDNRVNGRDIAEDDIIQLRAVCRISGVKAFIDTANTRDSIYRASIDFVLNYCSRQSTSVMIDGEDARQFIAGLADNIGIEHIRAARMVSAVVAARTKLCFLQAWALEMQGKHSEAFMELSKICVIHQIFPPEEHSPEIEMVALGLEKHLKVEQRIFLRNMLTTICSEKIQRSITEALGLVHLLPDEHVGD